jgi:hypothetical protein
MKPRNHHAFLTIRIAGLLDFGATALDLVMHASGTVQKSPLAGQPDRSELHLPKPAPERKGVP